MRNIKDDKYQIHIKVKFPFKLTPKRDEMRPGFVFLYADKKVYHPAVIEGYLDRQAFFQWVSKEISPCRSGKINYHPVVEFDYMQLPEEYLPSMKLGLQHLPWYAVPNVTTPLDRRSFMVWAPDWERCMMDNHQHSQTLSCLLKSLCLKNCHYVKGIDWLIRSLLLHEIPTLPRDLGASLMVLLETLVNKLKVGRLSPFLVDNVNLLSMDMQSLEILHDVLNSLLTFLRGHIEKAKMFSNDIDDEIDDFSEEDDKEEEEIYRPITPSKEDDEENEEIYVAICDTYSKKEDKRVIEWYYSLLVMFGLA